MPVLSTRDYARLLDEANCSPKQRREAEAWLAARRADGIRHARGQREILAIGVRQHIADAINASQLAERIANDVASGVLDPAEAMMDLRNLAAIVERGAAEVPQVRAAVERLDAMEPLQVFDELVARFPPLGPKIPPAP